jgi:hypothetical protein
MSDPNMDDFNDRVAKIQRDHSAGLGMEAEGTLGRSAYSRRSRRRIPIVAPVLLVIVCGIGLKAALHASIGEQRYTERVSVLESGDGLDKFGAILMTADPITLAISDQINNLMD